MATVRYLLVGILLLLSLRSDSAGTQRADSLATSHIDGLAIWSGSPMAFAPSIAALRP